jgi:predicted alpha/beta-fold hydrolase
MVGFSAGTSVLMSALVINQQSKSPVPVLGAMVVCIVASYITTRDNLENCVMGTVYSRAMTMKHRHIIEKNKMVLESAYGSAMIRNLLSSKNLRDFDSVACNTLYGYSTTDQLDEAYSCISPLRKIKIPILAIQPADDPLHSGKARENNKVDELIKNRDLIYLEPSNGSHFGFYEGKLIEAFTNKTSYTYPARCAVLFFDAVIETQDGQSFTFST